MCASRPYRRTGDDRVQAITAEYPDVTWDDVDQLCAARGLERVYTYKAPEEQQDPHLGRKEVRLYSDADTGLVVEAHTYTASQPVDLNVHAELARDGAYDEAVAELAGLEDYRGIVSHHADDRAVVDLAPEKDPLAAIDAVYGMDAWTPSPEWAPVRHYFAHATRDAIAPDGPLEGILPPLDTVLEAAGSDGDDHLVRGADHGRLQRLYRRAERTARRYREDALERVKEVLDAVPRRRDDGPPLPPMQ